MFLGRRDRGSRAERLKCLLLFSCYIARFRRPAFFRSLAQSLSPDSPLTNVWNFWNFWNKSYWMLFCHG